MMNADTTKALAHARKPKHDLADDRHHECEGARNLGIGPTELRQELDAFAM